MKKQLGMHLLVYSVSLNSHAGVHPNAADNFFTPFRDKFLSLLPSKRYIWLRDMPDLSDNSPIVSDLSTIMSYILLAKLIYIPPLAKPRQT